MSVDTLRILQVNTADQGGGAEAIALNLHRRFQARGLSAALAVGYKKTSEPNVFVLRNASRFHVWWWLHDSLAERRLRGALKLRRMLRILRPHGLAGWWRGLEDFEFPGTRTLLTQAPFTPHVVHAHNLHGEYFDLRALPELSERVPLALTLHDAWLLSGHCAHSFGCERWQTGCGSCPDLTIPPAIRRDATAENWRRKQALFAHSRLWVSAPSRWLLEKSQRSMLATAIAGARVITNGVDLSHFHPPDCRVAARTAIGVPTNAIVILCVANSLRTNPWKDFHTLRQAMEILARNTERIVLLALGGAGPAEQLGNLEVHFVPFQSEVGRVARYYQAADVYLHSALVDTFPTTVLEAMACGVPVVATMVGGIPEQIREGETGWLVPPRDANALAAKTLEILRDPDVRQSVGRRAAEFARQHFDLERQVSETLSWYTEIISEWRACKKTNHVFAN